MHTLKLNPFQGKFAWVAILAMIMVTAALAGCLHDSDDEDEDSDDGDPQDTETDTDDPDPTDTPEPPIGSLRLEAALQVDRPAGWAGNDTFTFDASNSSVTNGEIVDWTFDFGDGNTTTVDAGDDPVVEYEFERGGLYLVSLTVQAQGLEGEETVNETDVASVSVSERHFIEADDNLEGPLIELLGDQVEWNETFAIRAGAASFSATFQIEEESGLENSAGTLSFEFPEGEELASEDFEGSAENLTVAGDLDADLVGDALLRLRLDQGEIGFKGVLEVIYGVHPDDVDTQ